MEGVQPISMSFIVDNSIELRSLASWSPSCVEQDQIIGSFDVFHSELELKLPIRRSLRFHMNSSSQSGGGVASSTVNDHPSAAPYTPYNVDHCVITRTQCSLPD